MPAEHREVASEQAVQCLRLHLAEGVGPRRFRLLLEQFGSVEEVMRASRRDLESVRSIGRATSEAIEARREDTSVTTELHRAGGLGARIICQADGDYPELLREIPDAPVCLYVQGGLSPDDRCALAVVGSRRCTHYGQEQGYQFGMAAARVGMTVVSGLARGIDARAHRGALDCGGRTIAVLGCGLGHLQHHQNALLGDSIVEQGGAVISELPVDRPPDAPNFPPRNRIIAGLSLGTLVVEAALRSGALITARLALEYNREVFALPGRVDTGFSAGVHRLIRSGRARLVTGIQEILEELQHAAPAIVENYEKRSTETLAVVESHLTDDERRILDVLTPEGIDLEQVCILTRLPPERISSALTLLQLKGVVEQLPGNRFARVGIR
jgi:DNA processing protein